MILSFSYKKINICHFYHSITTNIIPVFHVQFIFMTNYSSYLTKHKEMPWHVIKWFTEGSFFKMNWMQICLKVCFIEDLTTTMYMFIQISLGSPLLCDISHWSTISCVMLLIKGPFDIFSWGPFNYIKCDSVYVFLRFR